MWSKFSEKWNDVNVGTDLLTNPNLSFLQKHCRKDCTLFVLFI